MCITSGAPGRRHAAEQRRQIAPAEAALERPGADADRRQRVQHEARRLPHAGGTRKLATYDQAVLRRRRRQLRPRREQDWWPGSPAPGGHHAAAGATADAKATARAARPHLAAGRSTVQLLAMRDDDCTAIRIEDGWVDRAGAGAQVAGCSSPYRLRCMPDAKQPAAPAPTYTTAAMLERLVAFDTTSRNSNLALIGFVREYLDMLSVPYRVSFDQTGQRANLHAVIGPQTGGGIALSGHVDTVPVDDQAWNSDPFRLRTADGRLYGRGTADMKGFVAACLAAVPDLQARGFKRPVHLFISYDEEVGCHGARRLVADLAESGLRPALCVVGEPSSNEADHRAQGKAVAARERARQARPFQRAGEGRQCRAGRRRGRSPG